MEIGDIENEGINCKLLCNSLCLHLTTTIIQVTGSHATSTLGKQGTRMSGWEFSKEIEKQDKENSLFRVAFVA